jgi:hypothetical protein
MCGGAQEVWLMDYLLEKLKVTQLFKKFSDFDGTQKFMFLSQEVITESHRETQGTTPFL